MRFKVLNGTHRWSGRKYQTGEVVDVGSDGPELDKMFQNKFKRVASQPREDNDEEAEEGPVAEEVAKPKPKKAKKAKASDSSKLGNDVTEEFPVAAEAGVLVFRNGNRYYIADPAERDVALNDEPLSKAEVSAHIEGNVSSEEDEE